MLVDANGTSGERADLPRPPYSLDPVVFVLEPERSSIEVHKYPYMRLWLKTRDKR
jgi:hypothetical protein